MSISAPLAATPVSLVTALENRKPPPADVELFYFLTSGLQRLWNEAPSKFAHRCFFVGTDARDLVRDGRADYVPISLAHVPELIANGRLQADVAFLQVSPPDEKGFVSLGISVDIGMAVVKHAKAIVVEVNPSMPRTHGDTNFMSTISPMRSSSIRRSPNTSMSRPTMSRRALRAMSPKSSMTARRSRSISAASPMRH